MCGIAGVLAFSNHKYEIDELLLNQMRDTMEHRGPDGAGTWIDQTRRVGLAHRRLSIIDLSTAAAQPMANEAANVVISFNGEIYNHAEIREELDRLRNINWYTDHSDTEVILRAYEQWGIACLEKFRGMFGIAIWDENLDKLFLVRDRFGVKPVYYTKQHDRLIFASEIKAIIEDKSVPRKINEEAMYHYLSFLTTPAPTTLFENIYKLPPGSYLEVNSVGVEKLICYYDVLDHICEVPKNEYDLAKGILKKLKEAVRLRKIGDVPVGVFLSGGIDSSTNAALFNEESEKKVKSFAIGYDVDYSSYVNELHHAKRAADYVGAEHYELKLTEQDLIDFLPKMIRLQDEPIADPVCVPVYFVSKLAKDNGVTVCQVGEGADELFWGYPTWKLKWQLQKLGNIAIGKPFQHLLLGLANAFGKTNSLPYEALRRSVNNQPVFWGGAESFTQSQKQKLFSEDYKNRYPTLNSWQVIEPIYQKFKQKYKGNSDLHWMTYLDLNFRLPELLLMRVDKMSMGVSLEGRVPFLDHKFVEYAFSIPEKVKTKGGVLKYILKKAVRGLIPDDIIDRKKQGFGVPVHDWVLSDLGDDMRDAITDFNQATGYFNSDYLDELFATRQSSNLWYLYNLSLWWREYVKVP